MYLFQAVLNLASTIWVNLDFPCYMPSFLLHLVGTQNPPAKAWILGDPTIPGVAKPVSCEGLAAVFLWGVPSALSK